MVGRHDVARLSVEALGGRVVPAQLVGGNLVVEGTAGDDYVVVRDAVVGGREVIRVEENGAVQEFDAAAVTGRVVFHGRAGNDRFGHHGRTDVVAFGGRGHDVLGVVTARAVLVGGRGSDSLYGGTGDDVLVGGPGGAHIHTGGGNDLYNGAPAPEYETYELWFVPGAEPDVFGLALDSVTFPATSAG